MLKEPTAGRGSSIAALGCIQTIQSGMALRSIKKKLLFQCFIQERLSSKQTREGTRHLAKENQSPYLHKVWKTLNNATVGSICKDRKRTSKKKEYEHQKNQTFDDKYQWHRPEAQTSPILRKEADGEDDDLSKDMSGPESPPELRRSEYVKGHIRFKVISSVLAQRYQRTVRQRSRSRSSGKDPELPSVSCLLPLPTVFLIAELAGVWACSADLLIL
nr:hypothetical protein [Tanacetum cinerariifolium]